MITTVIADGKRNMIYRIAQEQSAKFRQECYSDCV